MTGPFLASDYEAAGVVIGRPEGHMAVYPFSWQVPEKMGLLPGVISVYGLHFDLDTGINSDKGVHMLSNELRV